MRVYYVESYFGRIFITFRINNRLQIYSQPLRVSYVYVRVYQLRVDLLHDSYV